VADHGRVGALSHHPRLARAVVTADFAELIFSGGEMNEPKVLEVFSDYV
jgi:hypothetical protein